MDQAERRSAVVVLYAKLRNFDRLTEILAPPTAVDLAREFFALAARVVADNRGEVLGIANDALLAVFSDPARAVEGAKAAQREFLPVGERWQDAYGVPVAIALGAHLGDVVIGRAEIAMNAPVRVAYGECVSIAERLVLRARAGEIVLSGDLLAALGVEPASLGAEPLPPLARGRRTPIPIYGLVLETRLDFTIPMPRIG